MHLGPCLFNRVSSDSLSWAANDEMIVVDQWSGYLLYLGNIRIFRCGLYTLALEKPRLPSLRILCL